MENKLTIEREPNIVLESVGLLLQLKSDTDFAQMQRKIERKYGIRTPALEKKFDLLCRIEADAKKKSNEIQSDLDYYFTGGVPEVTTIGEVALLWWDTDIRFDPHFGAIQGKTFLSVRKGMVQKVWQCSGRISEWNFEGYGLQGTGNTHGGHAVHSAHGCGG